MWCIICWITFELCTSCELLIIYLDVRKYKFCMFPSIFFFISGTETLPRSQSSRGSLLNDCRCIYQTRSFPYALNIGQNKSIWRKKLFNSGNAEGKKKRTIQFFRQLKLLFRWKNCLKIYSKQNYRELL